MRRTAQQTSAFVRIRPELSEWRYYSAAPCKGRIGTEGLRRFDPHPDTGSAINALAARLLIKRRRGYQDRLD